jgi:GT2 family glycosyltransferase
MDYIKAWAEGKIDVWVDPKNPLRRLSFPPVPKPIPYVYYTKEEAEKGGNPNIEEILKGKIPKGVTTKHPIILIQSGANLGFAGGNNVGIKYVLAKKDSRYIWLLNNDTAIEKDALSKMVEVIEKNEKIGIVGSKLLYYDKPDILQTLCGSYKMTWYNAGAGKYIQPFDKDSKKNDIIFEIEGYIVGASMLIRNDVFEDIGLFDENYFMWKEESDLCLRTIRKGWKLFCAGKAKVYHKEGASTGKGKTTKFMRKNRKRPTFFRFVISGYLEVRNGIYFVKKHYGNFYAFLYTIFVLPKKTLRMIAGILLLDDFKIKRLKLILKAIKDGWLKNMGKPKELI